MARTGCSFPSATQTHSPAAIRRYFADDEPARAAARDRVRRRSSGYSTEHRARRRSSRRWRRAGTMKPRVLFVARTRYALPLDPDAAAPVRRALRRDRLAAVRHRPRPASESATTASRSCRRFPLAPPRRGGVLRGASGAGRPGAPPLPSRRRDRPGRPGHGPRAPRAPARARPTSRSSSTFTATGGHDTRVYGSPLRRLLSPLADAAGAGSPSGVPTASAPSPSFTTELVREQGVEPIATFPAYMDLEPFPARPPAAVPGAPEALFVGVLERYKAVDVLAEAWRRVRRRSPAGAPRTSSARGRLETSSTALVADSRLACRWTPRAADRRVSRAALDAATLLVLPSRREGMGRVIVEAFCRGRAVVGTDVGRHPRPRRGRCERAPRAGRRRRRARRRARRGCSRDRGRRSAPRRRGRTRLQRVGGDARGVRRAGCATLVDRVLAPGLTLHAARLRHPAGRPRRPRARGHRREDRGRSPPAVDEVVVLTDNAVAGSLPANCRVRTFAAGSRGGPGAALRAGARSPSSRRRPRPAAVIAHMCPIYAVLAAPLARPFGIARAALVRALEPDADARSSRCASRTSSSASIAARCRSRRRRSSASATASTWREFPCARRGRQAAAVRARRARPLLAREGARDDRARSCQVARDDGLDVRLRCHGTVDALPASARPRAARARSSASSSSATRSCSAARCRGSEVPALLARADAARQQHAPRCARQGRLRGVRVVSARCSSRTRSFDDARSTISSRRSASRSTTPTALAAAIAAPGAARRGRPRPARHDAARARRRRRHSVGVLGRRGRRRSRRRVSPRPARLP